MTIGISIIGAGIRRADHARILAEDLPGTTLRVAGTDPEAAIARTDVDAVIVASHDPAHAPLSLACIRAGKPVRCEKPPSQSPRECLDVIGAGTRVLGEGRSVAVEMARRPARHAPEWEDRAA